jgi:hypothetical protein
VGVFVLLALAIQTFVDVFNRKNVTAKIEYQKFNIYDFDASLEEFLEKTNVNFKVKAYNFWDLQNEPLVCENIQSEMTYLIPNGTLLNFTLSCSESEDGLYYKVIRDQALFSSIRIENY